MAEQYIFYSQVDDNLQLELNARGKAGFNRTTDDVNYMVTKIANVRLDSYPTTATQSADYQNDPLYTLGDRQVVSETFMPSNYLSPDRALRIENRTLLSKSSDINMLNHPSDIKGRNQPYTSYDYDIYANKTHKLPPFITACDVSMNDHQMGLLNTATINITIPNPDLDLDFIESTFCRPGRSLKLTIEHPDTALLLKKELKSSTIQTSIKSNINSSMNKAQFDMILISFNISYQTDATVVVTLHMRGTSNVYTDVSMLMVNNNQTATTSSVGSNSGVVNDFYKQIYDYINFHLKLTGLDEDVTRPFEGKVYQTYEVTLPGKTITDDHWYLKTGLDTWDKLEHRYISLGALIKYINLNIIKHKQTITPNALIVCNELECKSNDIPLITSADPTLLYIPGTESSTYGNNQKNTPRKWFNSKYSWKLEGIPRPSRMYIGFDLIKAILKDKDQTKFTITEFLNELSFHIKDLTGGIIDMKLITHPDNLDYLLYYDSNYIGGSTKQVTPYNVPMLANHKNGTIIREFKIDAKLPPNVQSLMYTINNSDTISEEDIAPYLSYMYLHDIYRSADSFEIRFNNPEKLEKFNTLYNQRHQEYKTALLKAKQKLGDTKSSPQAIMELKGALKKYAQYPMPNIKQSINLQAPIYPYEIEFTIDGINGLRYGDVLEFDVLPNRYKNNARFSILSVNHNVSVNGEWVTRIRCLMRAHIE